MLANWIRVRAGASRVWSDYRSAVISCISCLKPTLYIWDDADQNQSKKKKRTGKQIKMWTIKKREK